MGLCYRCLRQNDVPEHIEGNDKYTRAIHCPGDKEQRALLGGMSKIAKWTASSLRGTLNQSDE
eukprot:6096024-Heterocapsa_arctica.AAC.1